jgi:hypothetical protein
VGLILNIRYFEIVDFFPGWFGLDLAGDDGHPYGKWPWQSDYSGNMPERLGFGGPPSADSVRMLERPIEE